MEVKIKKYLIVIVSSVLLVSLGCGIVLCYLLKRRQPNIILITLDALRPDHLGCYGYGRNTSPAIDKIAQEGALFAQAIAQSSHTAGSITSLITSTYPNVHHVQVWGDQLNPQIPCTLAEILNKHGYETAFISDQTAVSVIKGFESGFGTFNTIRSSTFALDTNIKKIIDIGDWAIRWLKKNQRKKFFLWLYFLDPHAPYIPPPPYDTLFLNDTYARKINKNLPISEDIFNQFSIGAIPKFVVIDNITDADYYVAQYDGQIRYADDQIGRLYNALKKLRLDKNTLIIITSDHGEGMGEHNQYFCHGTFLYDELIRTTLIVKFDNYVSIGKKIDTQVRTIDIVPTILDIIGIAKYKFMQGESLMPLLGRKQHPFPTVAYSQFRTKISVRENEWKLIYDSKRAKYELYNLKKDPAETSNLILMEKDTFEFMKRKLDEYILTSKEHYKILAPVSDKSLKEQISSLGYIQ